MWFKNLCLYRFQEPFTLSDEELEQQLGTRYFQPCGRLDPLSTGWCSPFGRNGQSLSHACNGFTMICAQKEEKILPASVINDMVMERIEEIEQREHRKIGKKERNTLRDDLVRELLPQAFSHRRRTFAYIDRRGGWLVVDSSSAKRAEELISLLRETIGSVPVRPLTSQSKPSEVLTEWLAGEQPLDIVVDDECELISTDEEGGIIRCKRHDLFAPEIKNHLEAGKQVNKLAVTWHDRIAFVLDDALTIKKLRFLDAIQDQVSEVETDDAQARFDVDFSIMTLELANLLPRLLELFGGEAKTQ